MGEIQQQPALRRQAQRQLRIYDPGAIAGDGERRLLTGGQFALAVAVAKRSHLLAFRDVPFEELRKQPIIRADSTADDAWHAEASRLLHAAPEQHDQTVATFELAMTLVAAGYGVAVAPEARLAGYRPLGIAVRPLAGAVPIVMAFLLRRCSSLTETQERFAERARSVV